MARICKPRRIAIGFRTSSVAESLEAKKESGFNRVWYDPSQVARITKQWAGFVADGFVEAFADAQEALEKLSDLDERTDELAKRLWNFQSQHLAKAVLLCSLLKNQSFKEEKEWRLIRDATFLADSFAEKIKFRQGPLGLTPYMSIDLRGESGKLPISEIVVGPGADMELRIAAVRILLRKLKYPLEIPIVASTIPYRP